MRKLLFPGKRAFEHVRYLSEEIGPRPAGSQAERQAHDYVAEQLERWGYDVQRHQATFAPLPRIFLPNTPVFFMLVLGGWGIDSYPWLSIWIPLVVMALPQATRWWMRQRPRTHQTQNLVAHFRGSPQNAPELILCAHVDSARVSNFGPHFLRRLQGRTMDIILRVAYVIAVLALLTILGLAIPNWLHLAAGLAGSVAGLWLATLEIGAQFFQSGRYSPGANDNASGVGVLLALAEHFVERPTDNLRLGFLFTGAEETGMHGADAFAEDLKRTSAHPMVLGLDMVGSGDTLRVITHEGILLPVRTDNRLNELIHSANPKTRDMRYTLKSGDFAPFLRQGIPATTIQTSGSIKAETAYHALDDTVRLIDIQALKMTTWTIIKLVGLIDQ